MKLLSIGEISNNSDQLSIKDVENQKKKTKRNERNDNRFIKDMDADRGMKRGLSREKFP